MYVNRCEITGNGENEEVGRRQYSIARGPDRQLRSGFATAHHYEADIMNSPELVTVYTVANPVQGEIIKNALQDIGIRCFLDGVNQAAEAGLIALEIKVLVAPGDVDRARKLIDSHEAGKHAKPHAWTEKK